MRTLIALEIAIIITMIKIKIKVTLIIIIMRTVIIKKRNYKGSNDDNGNSKR